MVMSLMSVRYYRPQSYKFFAVPPPKNRPKSCVSLPQSTNMLGGGKKSPRDAAVQKKVRQMLFEVTKNV